MSKKFHELCTKKFGGDYPQDNRLKNHYPQDSIMAGETCL